jgi:DNA-binding HxlR family transcriptional regulator
MMRKIAAQKAWKTIRKKQSIRKKEVKRSIIEFLRFNPRSRNGDIWKHIRANKKTSVSLKMFSSYLAELVDGGQIEKTTFTTYGEVKHPVYVLTSLSDREQMQIFLNDSWRENMGKILGGLEVTAAKISSERLGERMYYVYSILNGLFHKQRIWAEFKKYNLLLNQPSYKAIATAKRIDGDHLAGHGKTERSVVKEEIPEMIDDLFVILDNLTEKKRRETLEKMIELSEADYTRILHSLSQYEPKQSTQLIIANQARLHLSQYWWEKRRNAWIHGDSPPEPTDEEWRVVQRIEIVDNFWDGWPDE